jgi:hypothetical protein
MAPCDIARLLEGDVVFLEGAPAQIEPLFQESWLQRTGKAELKTRNDLGSDSVRVAEAIVRGYSPLVRQSIRGNQFVTSICATDLVSIYLLSRVANSRVVCWPHSA